MCRLILPWLPPPFDTPWVIVFFRGSSGGLLFCSCGGLLLLVGPDVCVRCEVEFIAVLNFCVAGIDCLFSLLYSIGNILCPPSPVFFLLVAVLQQWASI